MKRIAPYIVALWLPLVVAALFILASVYQQEILLRLSRATVAQFITFFPYVMGIGIWISLAWLVNRVLFLVLWEPLNRRVPIPRLLRDVTGALIYAMALTGIVGVVFNKPIGPFWAASGAGAIVIGLALRNVILDVFIGLAVNFDRPFEIGDYIQVNTGPTAGPSGRVVELNWRTTRLVTSEGNMIVIPNGKLGDLIVTNFSKPDAVGEFEVIVNLDFDVSSDRALRVLNAAVGSVAGKAGILEDPAPKTRIVGTTAQGVGYKIKYFQNPRVAGPGRARHEVWKAVLDQLNRAGLQPATPKQDVFHAARPQRQYDSRTLEDRVALLARVELFEGLTVAERTELSTQMRERMFKQGQTVIRRGDAGDSMFILCEGLLEVRLALKSEGGESRVARLEAGMFFGEMSALTGESRSATIVAATDALTFEITKDDIATLIRRRPELAEIVSRAVTIRKLRNTEAVAKAGTEEMISEEKSLTAQLVGRIFAFLGLKAKPATTARQREENATGSPFS